MIAELRALAGDALIAVGEVIRGGSDNVDVWPDEYSAPASHVRYTTAAAIAPTEVRAAIDELADSELLNIAARVIAGWKPILLSAEAGALTDVDVLVDALRDRAAQFAAAE